MSSAIEICQSFFQAAYGAHDATGLGRFLTEDVTWHGDTELISATGRAPVLFILGYAIQNYMLHMQLKQIKLNEKEIRSGIYLVEGTLLLGDNVTEDKGFRFAAICIAEGTDYAICNMQFHMLKSTGERSYSVDRMLNSFYDGMPFSVLIYEHKDGMFVPSYFNEAFQHCVSRDKEACLAAFERDSFWFVSQEERSSIQNELKSILNAVPNPKMICKCKMNEANDRWFRFSGNSFRWIDQREFVVTSLVDITGEVNASEIVQRAIDHVPTRICVLEIEDQQIHQTFLNTDFAKTLGYEKSDLLKRGLATDADKIHPEDRSLVQETIGQMLAGEDEIGATFRLRNRYGTYLWVNFAAKRIVQENGKYSYYGVYTNIDEKIRSLEELNTVKKEVMEAVSLLPCAVAQFTLEEGMITASFFSDRLCEILGLKREEYRDSISPSLPFGAITDEETARQIEGDLRQGEKSPKALFVQAERSDRSVVWLRILYSARKFGSIRKLNMVIEDATEEIRLKESELWQNERYRILSASSNATIIDYNPKQNQLVYEVFSTQPNSNQKREFCTKQSFFDETMVIPEDLAAAKALFARLENEVLRGTMELRARHLSPEFRWYRLHYVSLAEEDGTIFRVLFRMEDIQSEKEAVLCHIEKEKRESQFRKSIQPGTLLARMFNITKDEWMPTDYDIQLGSMQAGLSFHQTLLAIADQTEGQEARIHLLKEFSELRAQAEREREINKSFVLRLQDASVKPSAWVMLVISITFEKIAKNFYATILLVDINEQKTRELAELKNSNIDTLTGLLNRRSFEHEITRFLSDSGNRQRLGYGCALACVEIDGMGRINDLCGYERGDALLIQSAQTIQAMLRGNEFASRNDGDKFLILLEESSELSLIEERLRILCTALNRTLSDQVTVTVSIGCVRIKKDQVFDRKLYEYVSKALFAAKIKGGGHFVVYSEKVDSLVTQERNHAPANLDFCEPQVFIRTFGHFDVLVQDKTVYFNYPKAKELLALIVDRNGGYLSAGDAIGCLWEDMPASKGMYAKFRKTALQLKTILERNGIPYIIESKNGKRRANVDRFDCDYYGYLKGTVDSKKTYAGQYMVDYSWAEDTIAVIEALNRG